MALARRGQLRRASQVSERRVTTLDRSLVADVRRYLNALGAIPILKGVRLDATESKEIEGRTMRQFRISMRIEPDANLRTIGDQVVPAPQDPMRIPADLRAGAIEPSGTTDGGTE